MTYSTLYKTIKIFLAGFGAVALLASMSLAILYYKSLRNEDQRDNATNADVAFVLNETGLDSTQKHRVIHSFESARPPIINDHVDGYCIALQRSDPNAYWRKATDLEKPFLEAVVFGLNSARQELPCMPSESQLLSGNILVQSVQLRFVAIDQIDGGEVALLDPSTNALFYITFQM